KTLDFDPPELRLHTTPTLLDDTTTLVGRLREFSAAELGALMKLSDRLAELNFGRFQDFAPAHVLDQGAKQALLAFNGDVYRDWPLETYSEEDFRYAQQHLRILSGLYGVLRPLDLIQPYRLEMGTRLATERGKTLYAFWGDRITQALNADLDQYSGKRWVINLASNEYFKSVKTTALNGRVVSPVFRDWSKGAYKVVAVHAKRARGMMAHDLIARRVTDMDGLKRFALGGYRYDEASSTDDAPVFLRKRG
ncbi:MAG: peroxide stress protein YaaA, partial [Myxococcota bacterium]